MLWLESDAAVLGAPSFVMRHVEGFVPSDDPSFAASGWVLGLSSAQRDELCTNALEALARVHAVDWRKCGLGWLGRTEPGDTSAERELRYYEDFYRWAAEGRSIPVIEHALR
jgi:aminoglycoside phosphotransferase (APT) family kinase protein